MTRIRVLLVAPSLEIVGGQSVQAARLMDAFSSEPEIEAAFQPTNPRLPRLVSFLRRIKYLRTIATEIAYSVQVLRRSRRVDIIHVFAAGYSSFFLTMAPAIAAARLRRKPVILNHHDGRAGDHFRRSRFALYLARSAAAIAVPSAYLVDVLAKFQLKAMAIFNIVDTGKFCFRPRPKPAPRFLHNRGLEPHYNPGCSIRAFGIVQGRYPHATLTMAHDGSSRPSLESLVADLRLKNVRFLGRVDQAAMRALYHECDIYLMSPEVDNMPLSVLECFASGMPVVSTSAGGVPFLVDNGRTGILVPLNDHKALASAALRIIEEDGLALSLEQNALAECTRYQPERVTRDWLALYRRLKSQVPN
ncbi:MAG TPA: glycosyltransferase family 4 protein [Bryobacteraceae bacterium]|nr:glycosyltransferase family 4 protein [Bryobacteraceae bacterium]